MAHADTPRIFTLPIDPHRLTVSCPRKGKEVPFDDCRGCELAWLVHVNADRGPAFVICEDAAPPHQGLLTARMAEARVAPVSTIMAAKVISVGPSLCLETLILLLIDRDIGGVPVLDGRGQPVGMVSRKELGDDRAWGELRDDPELLRTLCVADIMTPEVVRVRASGSVADAALAIASRRAQRALVIDAAGEVAGIVTASDIDRWMAASPSSD